MCVTLLTTSVLQHPHPRSAHTVTVYTHLHLSMAGRAVISEEAEKGRKAVWGRKAPFVTFYLAEEKNDRIVKVETTGQKGQDYLDLMKCLDDKNCRYFLYDYVTIDPKFNKKKEKTVFVFWFVFIISNIQYIVNCDFAIYNGFMCNIFRSPPNCNQQMKMMYSAYLVNCRDDMKFSHHETFQEDDDFSMFKENQDDDDDEDSEMSD